jgi:rubrerythrin
MIAELDASNLYEKLAELADNNVVKETLLDVSKEEKVHVGEFQALLEDIDEDYTEALEDGEGEVDDAKEE